MTQRFFPPTRSNSTFDELSTEPRQTPISACLFLWPPLRLPPRRMAHTRTLQSMAHPDGWWPAGAVLPCAAQPRSVCRPGVRARACGRRLARVPGRPVDVPIIPGGPGRDSCRTRPTCSSYACLKLLRPGWGVTDHHTDRCALLRAQWHTPNASQVSSSRAAAGSPPTLLK